MNLFIRSLFIMVCLYSCGWTSAAEVVDGSAKFQESANLKKEDKMSEATQVAAKHILVDTEEKAKELLTKIQAGEVSFEDAAKTYSKCPSGSNGGDLGFFGRGAMVKEFEDASFILKVGEVSQPIKTQFGWHLIKVYGKK